MSVTPLFMHVAAQKPQNAPQNITLISSGKGGVGKTWLSITLSHLLAQDGKKVLLFDGDLGMPNVDVQLGVAPPRHLGQFMTGHSRLKETISRVERAQFDIIAGCAGADTLSEFPAHKLTLMQEELKVMAPQYDHVLLDLGAGLGRTSRGLATIARQCFMVILDEPTSLTDAYAFIKFNRQHNPDLEFKIIVNQADSVACGRGTYETISKVCTQFLDMTPPLAGIIRRDKRVRQRIREQGLFLEGKNHSPAAQDLWDMVQGGRLWRPKA